MLGPEPALCQAVFVGLLWAAELQEAAVAGLQQAPQPRRWMRRPFATAPGRQLPSRLPTSLSHAASAGAAAAARPQRGPARRGAAGQGRASTLSPAAGARPAAVPAGVGGSFQGPGVVEEGSQQGMQQPQQQREQLAQPCAGQPGPRWAGQRWLAAAAQRLRRAPSLLWPPPQQAQQGLALGITLVEASSLALGSGSSMQGGGGPSVHSEADPAGQLLSRRRAAGRQLQLIAAAVRRKGLQQLEQQQGAPSGAGNLEEASWRSK